MEISWPHILWKCIDSGYIVSATPHIILYRSFWNFAHFLHGLKMCMWFGYNPCINFCHFFHFANFVISWPQILWKCRQWIPCERNSSNNFIPIFSKLCTCFCHGLEMCMWFGYNPCINFCHFFHFANFVISWPQILWKCRQWIPCERNSSNNFIPIFSKLCTCFCHGLEMCMWFGYNPWINFCHFFHFVNFVIFWPQILWKCIDSGYHVSATPYTTSCLSSFNFAHLFVHGLKMCMWFGFNPAENFCHFVNFVIFHRCDINFTEVRSIFLLVLSCAGSYVR